MSRLLLVTSLLCGSQALAALNVNVVSATQTQALLRIQGFTGPCTLQVSASPALTPLHPDIDGTEYGGADTDVGRADTIISGDGTTRTVTIGHQTDDRALAAFTTYYYQVSGCGGPVTGNFVTANLANGTTRTEQTPINRSRWGNLALPIFDWTTKRTYIDPMTGVSLIPMATSVSTWRTGCGSSGCTAGNARTFTDWSGGNGWTNPSGVLLGASTSATTTNTNPIDVYADLSNAGAADPLPYDWHRTIEDIGIVVWGYGSSGTAADRVIDLCIFLNPSAGCASRTIQVTLASGSSVIRASSGSNDADGAFPAAFPSSPFFGWTGSNSPLIRMENRETFGTATISGNTLTIGNISTLQHFSSAVVAGQKIFLAGSSCANNLCTVAGAPGSPGTVSVTETPGNGTTAFRAYGWGIRVWKDNGNGSVKVGLRYKLAGSNTPIGVQAGGDKCSAIKVTSGDNKPGYLCSLTSAVFGIGYLAFVADDGTTRILSNRTGFSFDDTLGNVFYAGARNSSGGWTINKYTYTGDYTAELDYHYTCGPGGDCPSANDHVSATDLMPHSSGADLDQQIQANQGITLPAYNASIYGPWTQANGAIGYYGSSGHSAFFCNVYSGQGQATSGGPGWCAVVDLSQSPAKVVRLIHTLDGTGAPNARFGSLHSAQEVEGNPNTLMLSLDPLDSNNNSTLHGGPFQARVSSILMADGVTWSTDTCLGWPTGGGSCANPNYYRTCPANFAPYTECVTFRLPRGGVCNTAPTSTEKSNWPCPWNPNYSQYPLMRAGDNAVDLAGNPYNYDSEHFRILSVTGDDNNTLRVTAARNGVYDYCSISPWHGQTNPLSAQSVNQLSHASGWTLTMMPGTFNSCGVSVLLQEQTTGSVQELGHSFAGHFQTGRGPSGLNFVTSGKTIFNTSFASLGQIPARFTASADPAFHGNPAQIGNQLQSYTDDSQLSMGPAGYAWAIDTNPYVACAPESLGCGTTRSLTNITGNVYKIQTIGSPGASNLTYKSQPMIGWAGRFQLQDVSGPGSSIDSVPYAMCFAVNPGECHAGSVPAEVYVNVPTAYDPGYCSGSLSWVNVPCVMFGNNAPAGGIRQFRIYRSDSNGSSSRFISNGWSSVGRHYPYTHSTVYRSGQWAMLMGSNPIDGYSLTGFMISLPPWQERSDPDNDFKSVTVQLPTGLRYGEIQFGYSRYIGTGTAASSFYCTPRAESCNTSSAASSLFNFESEHRLLKTCASGCTIVIPAVAPNVLYYRVRRSNDGINWTADDIQAVALQ